MSKEKYKYIIIGNSVAGNAAVDVIKKEEKNADILILSEERYDYYSRPLITHILARQIPEKNIFLRTESFYKKNGITLLKQTKVEEIFPSKKAVKCGNKKYYFDKLLIATGGAPIDIPFEGNELKGIFHYTTMDDYFNVKRYIKEHNVKNVVIVGGGLIGMKTLESFIELNMNCSVIELADRLLPVTLDKKGSSLLEKVLKAKGIKIYLRDTIESVKGNNGRVEEVRLRYSGEKIKAELLIIAVGVRPRISLVAQCGIKTGRGVIVDKKMMTNISDIYSAGDVTEGYDLVMNENRVIAIWPAAAVQGKIAGKNMVHHDTAEYSGWLAMNSVELCGLPNISIGRTQQTEEDKVLVKFKPEQNFYRKIIINENRVVGAILIGKIDRAGIITGLIRNRVDISGYEEALLNDDFGLIQLPQNYYKHLVKGEGIEV